MMLADMGAEVVTLDRVGAKKNLKSVAGRGRKVVELDLKDKAAIAQVLDLLANADALIEGFRPGVMERLGLGPDVVQARNPRLVYGRMTGWGQEGPLAQAAGHDINYISVTGALAAIGTKDKAGAAAQSGRRFRRRRALSRGRRARRTAGSVKIRQGTGGRRRDVRRRGLADVDVLRHDGRGPVDRSSARAISSTAARISTASMNAPAAGFISIGSIEPQFYALLRQHAGLSGADFDAQMDRKAWPAFKQKLAEVFKTKTRDEWCTIMEGTDICFAPILTMAEAPDHPHMAARKIFVERHGVTQPAPAPRFSRTPSAIREAATADIAEPDERVEAREVASCRRPAKAGVTGDVA